VILDLFAEHSVKLPFFAANLKQIAVPTVSERIHCRLRDRNEDVVLMRERVASWRKEMLSCAVARHAVVLIAALLLLVVPARAQSQASVTTEEFAREAEVTQVPLRAQYAAEPDWRVTVLMVMAPGTYGIRRGASIADPILCTTDGCYVSNGADIAARFLPRRQALGVGNTLGARAGACRQSLSCVFRDVEFEYPALLQPVYLHILKHDRRRPQRVIADSDCSLSAGRLTCSRGIYAEDYALWIVPERLAELAGSEALERALRDGLSHSRSAEASPHPMR
jgi:hypothetical protein